MVFDKLPHFLTGFLEDAPVSQKIPSHLKKYIVDQNYKKYTSQDQAVWRYIMKGVRQNMSLYGVSGGLAGMEKTGITFDQIPKISDISANLQKFGWRAAAVSGFIPPAAFMEFQLHGILPVASELRSIDHISYTPAPDIVHEAAGHAPFLTHPAFSAFLKKYAQTVLKALKSAEDRAQYMAIRELSDLKENPRAAKAQIQKAERKLKNISKRTRFASEAARLSRLIWWTSEYGLMGKLKNPKIYGAGLISSIEETRQIPKARKLLLGPSCLNYSYDITRFQPQLFVAEDFSHLMEVLDRIAETLSFKRGGLHGARQAILSRTVNTMTLDSGLQISGQAERVISMRSKQLAFIKFCGPCQLSFEGKQLPRHGSDYHHHGYSTPLGLRARNQKPLHLWSSEELRREGLRIGQKACLKFRSRISLQGEVTGFLRKKGRLLLIAFKNCRITKGEELLFDPSWGAFDLALGEKAVSVFSGSADPAAYGEKDDFQPSRVPPKIFSQKQKKIFGFYREMEALRAKQRPLGKPANSSRPRNAEKQKIGALLKRLKRQKGRWLEALELLALSKGFPKIQEEIRAYLKKTGQHSAGAKKRVKEGLPYYDNYEAHDNLSSI